MDRPTARRLRACLAGTVGAALLAGVLAPAAAVAQTAPPSPTASPSPSPAPSGSPSPSAAPVSARPELPAPALVGPLAVAGDAPQPVLKDVVLAWRPVEGALGYRVQVSQDGDFEDDAVTLDAPAVGTRLTVPGWLPHAAYRWRVAAQQKAGHGFWSTSGAFTKGWRDRPSLIAPADRSEPQVRPVFSWSPVAGASEYEVQVSASPTFDQDPVRQQAGFRTTSCFTVRTAVSPGTGQAKAKNDGAGECDFSGLAFDEVRYWRVRALDHVVDAATEVDTTPVAQEGISSQPPQAEPETLDLGACPQPAGAGASAAPSATPSAAPSASASAAPASASCEAAHEVDRGPWSEVRTFTMRPISFGAVTDATYAPVAVKTLDPALCSERARVDDEGRLYDCVDFPTLNWDRREGAYRYRVYVALDDAFSNIQEIVETSALQWTPTTAWRDTTASQSYYYAVQACTEVRCGLVSSAVDSLRKKNPRTELTSPASGSLFGPVDVALRWKPFSTTQRAALSRRVAGTPAASEAYAYRVQVAVAPQDGRPATDADFQDLVEDVVVDGALCRPAAVAADATVDPRTTQRAVRSCDGSGGYVAHDPQADEVIYVSPAKSYPTGSYVWRVQALDASAHKMPWSAVGTFTRDITPPTVVLSSGTAVDSPKTARFSEPVRGISGSTVVLAPTTPTTMDVAVDATSAVVRPVGAWVPGQTYVLGVRKGITDLAGNALAPVSNSTRVNPLVDDGSKALAYGGAWGPRRASNAVGGGFRQSTPTMRAQTAATVTLKGTGVLVTGCVGPAGGMMDVWVDGTKRGRVDTYRSYSGCGVRLARVALADGVHRVQVRGVGMKRPASTGTMVMLDAINAL